MRLYTLLLAALLVVGTASARSAGTYDLIFKNGTLSDVSPDTELEYTRTLQLSEDPEYAQRNTGDVRLSFEADDMARLQFEQGSAARNLGAFPATVGNPIVMYFIETVLRDMSKQAGGSPFYIRNRIKESLLETAPVEDVSVSTDNGRIEAQNITLRPFLNDKNRDRMRGYENLEMTFTVSDEVPGWYQSMVANVDGRTEGQPLYQNALVLRSTGETE